MFNVRKFSAGVLCVGINFSTCIATALSAPPEVLSPAESIVIEEPMSPAATGRFACQRALQVLEIESERSMGCDGSETCIQQSAQNVFDRQVVATVDTITFGIGAAVALVLAEVPDRYLLPTARAGPVHQQAIVPLYLTVKIE